MALDIKQTGVIQGLPLQFSGNNLVKSIRSGTPQDSQSLRLVVDLTEKGKTKAVKQQNGANAGTAWSLPSCGTQPPPAAAPRRHRLTRRAPEPVYSATTRPARNPFKSQNDRITAATSSNTVTRPASSARRAVSGDRDCH